jgi:hypothetical protein
MRNTAIPKPYFGLGFSSIFTGQKTGRKKAQDRDGGERITSSSALNIGMKNAVLRKSGHA